MQTRSISASSTDYVRPTQPTIQFAKDQTHNYITIEILEDDEDEEDEVFVVSLLSATSGFIVHPMETEITIVNTRK